MPAVVLVAAFFSSFMRVVGNLWEKIHYINMTPKFLSNNKNNTKIVYLSPIAAALMMFIVRQLLFLQNIAVLEYFPFRMFPSRPRQRYRRRR